MKFTKNPRFEAEVSRTPEMRRFLARVAEDAKQEVVSRVPVDSGDLRDSVEADVVLGPDGLEGQVTVGGGDAFYWGMIEFGTSRKGARPYLRPGVQAALSRVNGRLGDSR